MSKASGVPAQGELVVQEFIHMLTNKGELTPKTLREYASDLKHFTEWYKGSAAAKEHLMRIEDVDTSTLTSYRDHSQNVLQLKPSTINRRLITLKRFFKWAAAESRISSDPSKPLKFIPEDKVSPRRMTAMEEQSFLSAVEQGNSLRDQTILTLMFHTGLRTMEVCNLEPVDIELGKRSGQLTVRADKRNGQRKIPLNKTCNLMLKKYIAGLDPHSPYLFPSEKTNDRLTERALRHLIKKVMTAAGLEGLSSHDLRHRFGYAMAERTPLHRLAEIMGHTNPDTTMIYVKGLNIHLSEQEKDSSPSEVD
ncbi:tyrosine-type recombinase/integrase [Paenibacillus xylanilyticus]|uniref:Tyrosine-type recombinase/integrase n=1 Tax=Paenibacillus xylanilyticus TaxID=248903 RepID=A0A7Y6EVL6_9BACL|nr:tyrosine-type recombinase/integrase [Paenibacillus xylanilyticus]NUU78397.1 tyrosine-type recombinase/integrase [Paenibacillus xylanilyticus]